MLLKLERFFRNEELWLAFVFLLSVIGLFASLACFGIIDPSDGFYSEAAREMIERHDYLTPYLNYQPFYEKPIGIYWLIIGSYKLFGINEFAARFPSAFCALICTLLASHILIRVQLKRVALLSAVILMATPLFAVVARLSLTDMPLTSCLTIALLSLWYFSLQTEKRGYLYTAYVMVAFAVLLKGPLAAFLCGLIFFAGLVSRTKLMTPHAVSLSTRISSTITVLKPYSIVSGGLIVLIISAPWYLFEIVHTQGEFFQEFILRQHFSRLEGLLSHQEPWYFYLLVFAVGTLPWSIFLVGLPNLLREMSEGRFCKDSDRMRADLLHFCMVWISVTIVVFSLSSAKLATYIVSTAVPASIIFAISMDYLVKSGSRALVARTAWIAALFAFVAIPVFAAITHFGCDRDDAVTIAIALSIAPVCALLATRIRNQRKMLYIVISGVALSFTLTLAASLHTYDEVRNRALRRMYLQAAAQKCSLGNFLRFVPGSLFYFRRPITSLKTAEDFKQFVQNTPPPHLVIAERSVSPVLEVVCPGLKRVRDEGDYCLMNFAVDSAHR